MLNYKVTVFLFFPLLLWYCTPLHVPCIVTITVCIICLHAWSFMCALPYYISRQNTWLNEIGLTTSCLPCQKPPKLSDLVYSQVTKLSSMWMEEKACANTLKRLEFKPFPASRTEEAIVIYGAWISILIPQHIICSQYWFRQWKTLDWVQPDARTTRSLVSIL